jgi:hypothetical protein
MLVLSATFFAAISTIKEHFGRSMRVKSRHLTL